MLMEVTVAWWAELVVLSDNVAYRLAFNTLLGTYLEGRAALQQVLEPELRSAEAYVAITRAVAARDAEAAARQTAELVALGNHSLFAALAAARHGA
jgi:DNA-binding FadR family transcriptional regulator